MPAALAQRRSRSRSRSHSVADNNDSDSDEPFTQAPLQSLSQVAPACLLPRLCS